MGLVTCYLGAANIQCFLPQSVFTKDEHGEYHLPIKLVHYVAGEVMFFEEQSKKLKEYEAAAK